MSQRNCTACTPQLHRYGSDLLGVWHSLRNQSESALSPMYILKLCFHYGKNQSHIVIDFYRNGPYLIVRETGCNPREATTAAVLPAPSPSPNRQPVPVETSVKRGFRPPLSPPLLHTAAHQHPLPSYAASCLRLRRTRAAHTPALSGLSRTPPQHAAPGSAAGRPGPGPRRASPGARPPGCVRGCPPGPSPGVPVPVAFLSGVSLAFRCVCWECGGPPRPLGRSPPVPPPVPPGSPPCDTHF